MKIKILIIVTVIISINVCQAQQTSEDLNWLKQYNVIWTSQSKNSSESMPVSGGDIGLNVWVENNELFFYIGQAGCRDENGALLKPGRVRINFTPNPFENGSFKQELKLQEGYVLITGEFPDGKPVEIKSWVEVSRPIVHVDITSDESVEVEATYESWRFSDMELPNVGEKHGFRAMCMGNYASYPGKVFLYQDQIKATEKVVRFFHRVDNTVDCFDFQVKQQELEPIRDQLFNPLENLVWGGTLVCDNFVFEEETSGIYAETPFKGWKYKSKVPANSHRIRVCLHVDQVENLDAWNKDLQELIELSPKTDKMTWKENQKWWEEFWNRSRIVINPGRGEGDIGWRIGRNYQLFRYMLASNVNGREPSLFNGGLFTFDPLYVKEKKGPGFTPDHRQWGGALTAQNQRLLVWPLLKTGDFDFFPTAFSFYTNSLQSNRERVNYYWNHDGCCFTELPSITGLPGAAIYGFNYSGNRGRLNEDIERGVIVNPNTVYLYQSQLEYAWIMLQYSQFSGADLTPYLKFIEQSVIFYDEHYRFRCKQLTGKELDENGKLVIYPSNALEKHTGARNPTSVIAGLKRVLTELLCLPDKYSSDEKRERWQEILNRLPEMPTGYNGEYGGRYLKPSEKHEPRSWHIPEMYPLYPYQLYGIGLPDLELLKNTFTASGKQKEYITWQQPNIHAARLGQTKVTQELNSKKMDNGPYRFPTFWPATIDWAPDHNWGGAGMIGMQEMILQTHTSLDEVKNGSPGKIRVLPAWPAEWDLDFKLHAPGQTVVEGEFNQGILMQLSVWPEFRKKDLVVTPKLKE